MSAPIEKEDDLFSPDETLFHRASEQIGEDCAVALFQFPSHIDDVDFGHFSIKHTRRQTEESVTSIFGEMETLK